MKKKIMAVALVIVMAVAFTPVSRAYDSVPYFIVVNDTLMPFNSDNMPRIIGGMYFVPHHIFDFAGVVSMASVSEERLQLYRGADTFLDFFTEPGNARTVDQRGNHRSWPRPRRIGSRFFVPLATVADYFDLTFEVRRLQDIDPNLIQDDRVHVLRIISHSVINTPTLVGMHENVMREAYDRHFNPAPPGPPTPPGPPEPPAPPNFQDVTVYLSFYDLSAGGAARILDVLDFYAQAGFRSTFFVTADEIARNSGLIRRIAGIGHTIGLKLAEGTQEEYLEMSALLFEAAKLRTVIISAQEGAHESAAETADRHGLILWGADRIFGADDVVGAAAVNRVFSTQSGARQSLRFACSDNTAAILPGILSFLDTYEYNVARITETTAPIR